MVSSNFMEPINVDYNVDTAIMQIVHRHALNTPFSKSNKSNSTHGFIMYPRNYTTRASAVNYYQAMHCRRTSAGPII